MTLEELRKNYKQRERKRAAKKTAFIAVPISLAVLFILIIVISAASQSSCFDGRQNGNEEGIDCGGDCVSCEIKNAEPIILSSVAVLAETDDFSGLLLKAENHNSDQLALFKYKIILRDDLGGELKSFIRSNFIYPSSVKYLLEAKIPLKKNEISRVEAEVLEVDWSASSLSASKIFSVADAKAVKTSDPADLGHLRISGKIINQSAGNFSKVDLILLLYSKTGSLLAVAKTQMFDLAPAEIRDFW